MRLLVVAGDPFLGLLVMFMAASSPGCWVQSIQFIWVKSVHTGLLFRQTIDYK
jgi:hypothetical protein